MKSKKILITVVAAVLVIAATFGITYAAWDKSSESTSLNAIVGRGVNVSVTQTAQGDANAFTLVPKNTPTSNTSMKDCLTLGAVKVTNNLINNISSDTAKLDIKWNVTTVMVTYVNTSEAVKLPVEEFKSIFKVSVNYSMAGESILADYDGIVPMDTELSVLMQFIDNAETISDANTAKFRDAKFVITVEFTAVAKA